MVDRNPAEREEFAGQLFQLCDVFHDEENLPITFEYVNNKNKRNRTNRGWTTAMSGGVQFAIGVFRAHVGASTHAFCAFI